MLGAVVVGVTPRPPIYWSYRVCPHKKWTTGSNCLFWCSQLKQTTNPMIFFDCNSDDGPIQSLQPRHENMPICNNVNNNARAVFLLWNRKMSRGSHLIASLIPYHFIRQLYKLYETPNQWVNSGFSWHLIKLLNQWEIWLILSHQESHDIF